MTRFQRAITHDSQRGCRRWLSLENFGHAAVARFLQNNTDGPIMATLAGDFRLWNDGPAFFGDPNLLGS
jgi:hypothetical protein